MSRPTILICDDEPDLRELMRLSLGTGYVFFEAADGAEAIELIESAGPDLVLLDMMMPRGGGTSVLNRLRSDPPLSRTAVIVVSAFSSDSDRRAALEAGADGFLGKPFDPNGLRSLVEELLAARK
jgi:CheY-like chemotaxis protein